MLKRMSFLSFAFAISYPALVSVLGPGAVPHRVRTLAKFVPSLNKNVVLIYNFNTLCQCILVIKICHHFMT